MTISKAKRCFHNWTRIFDSHQNGTAIRIVPESRFTSHRNADSHGPESAERTAGAAVSNGDPIMTPTRILCSSARRRSIWGARQLDQSNAHPAAEPVGF